MYAASRLARFRAPALSVYSRRGYSGRGENAKTRKVGPMQIKFIGITGLIAIITTVCTVAIEGVYNPLRHRGILDDIAQSTIFRVVGPKIVQPDRDNQPDGSMYQPFRNGKECRILILEPGCGDEEINCRLVNVILNWRTRYEALSYAWGEPDKTDQIVCCGRIMSVRVNLHSALRHLRYSNKQRFLWVDALCINQDDITERENQVQMMGSIYSKARQVLIWLGNETDDVKGAFQSLERLETQLKPLLRKLYVTNRHPALEVFASFFFPTREIAIQDPERRWSEIRNLFHRQWFQRIWVIQEAILAKRATVICGDNTIPWFRFERTVKAMAVYNAEAMPIADEGMFRTLKSIMMITSARTEHYARGLRRLQCRRENWCLLDFLFDCRHFGVSDQRDKVFGLLGVAKDVQGRGFEPNYRESVEQTWQRFTLWDISANRNLRVLSFGSRSDRSDGTSTYDLPSWVPDFGHANSAHSFARYEERHKFDATLGTKPQFRTSRNGRTLHIMGHSVDQVAQTGRLNDGSIGLFQSFVTRNVGKSQLLLQMEKYDERKRDKQEWIRECMDLAMKANNRFETVETEHLTRPFFGMPRRLFHDFWKTMVCGHDPRGLPVGRLYATWSRDFFELLFSGHQKDSDWMLDKLAGAQIFESGIEVYSQHRKFCATRHGRIGWIPANARENDLICILYGGRIPFVLRPIEGGHYILVGECYIHGLMNGEGMNTGSASQEFALS
ncbi:hypothetical protein HFD88_004575 [Aspergillus terreus]|nr:hypothetical protein HFD88_004575 [Aspergillus terreus]